MTDRSEAGSGHVTSELPPQRDTAPLDPASGGPDAAIHQWRDAAAAAGIAWLAVLCIGAVSALAPKLQFPTFARGADPIEVFTAVVVISLGLFGVPVHIGGLTISALPLGALAGIGAAIVWAAAGTGSPSHRTASAGLRYALRIAALFASAASLLALIFRLRGREVVAADAFWAFVATFVWTLPFAWAGAIRGPRAWIDAGLARANALARKRAPISGVWGGVVMVAVAFLLAAAALLIWMIIGLARGGPGPAFSAGDAGAAVLYLIAFLPNVLTALIALALGAPIVHGAQVGVGGRVIGGLEQISLLDGAPALAYLLILIPVIACGTGGWLLAPRDESRTRAWRSVAIAAVTFAATVALLAWLGEARVGAGLLRDRGVARLAVLPLPTFAWGILWASVFGWLGWELAMHRKRD